MSVSAYMIQPPSGLPWQQPKPLDAAPPQVYTAPPGWPFIVQGPSRAEHDALVQRVTLLELALAGLKPKRKPREPVEVRVTLTRPLAHKRKR